MPTLLMKLLAFGAISKFLLKWQQDQLSRKTVYVYSYLSRPGLDDPISPTQLFFLQTSIARRKFLWRQTVLKTIIHLHFQQ